MAMASSNLPRMFFLAAAAISLLLISSLPAATHARDIHFFSKSTHNTPALTEQPEIITNNNNNILPSNIPPTATKTEEAAATTREDSQHGYGLYGNTDGAGAVGEETYQYSPTTSNPTGNNNYHQMDAAAATVYSYDANGKLQQQTRPRFSTEGEVERGSHGEVYFTNNKKNQQQPPQEEEEEDRVMRNSVVSLHGNGGGAVERQGMSDTRFLENGRYYYHVSNEEKKYGGGTANRFDTTANENYEAESFEDEDDDAAGEQDLDEEDGHDKIYEYENRNQNGKNNYNNNNNNKYDVGYNVGGAQQQQHHGMSDTRYMANGRYFYDISNEEERRRNGLDTYNSRHGVVHHPQQQYRETSSSNTHNEHGIGRNDDAAAVYNNKPSGDDFRNTANKFPGHEFDSMEEYYKYQEQNGRASNNNNYQNGYRH